MIRGFYTATSGLVSQQKNLDLIANNMANTSTTGFKPQRSAFSSLVHEKIKGGAANEISMGNGVKIEKTDINFAQGEPIETKMTYDYVIIGEGFFALESAKGGEISYTRSGDFQLQTDGNKSYLIDAFGNYVLDSNEKRIEVGDKYNFRDIGVFNFQNVYGLEQKGGSGFIATERSGKAESAENPIVKQGYLESSAVDISFEMVKMIEASKSFSFNSKIIQSADEMERTINQLR